MQSATTRAAAGVAGFLGILIAGWACAASPSDGVVAPADYTRAQKLSPWAYKQLVRNVRVKPRWNDDGRSFWYQRETKAGKEFVRVDAGSGASAPAFDHVRLAAALGKELKRTVDARHLPFEWFRYAQGTGVELLVDGRQWRCSLQSYVCEARGQFDKASGELLSPDGKYALFRRERNLWIKDRRSRQEFALTEDGEKFNEYGWYNGSTLYYPAAEMRADQLPPLALWSPDSKKILVQRIDERKVASSTLWQAASPASARPILHEYKEVFPGESDAPLATLVMFDVETRRRLDLPVQPQALTFADLILAGAVRWTSDARFIYALTRDRNDRRVAVVRVEVESGSAREVLAETSETQVGVNKAVSPVLPLHNGDFLWWSERDGWGHLYLYDFNGRLKRQLTKGPWRVLNVIEVDERSGVLYFTAGGREADSNPYYERLYRVGLNGAGLRLLTPEDAHHEVFISADTSESAQAQAFNVAIAASNFSPDRRFFVDTFSRPDSVPVAVLRSRDGTVISKLEETDISALEAVGWSWPKPFKAKARDGKTDIYGTMYTPSHFDPKRKYPLINEVYPGAHSIGPDVASFNSPRVSRYMTRQALAELGFIVVHIDGLGTPGRSKAYHDVAYNNLQDGPGLPDQVTAMRQLAGQYSFIDLNRVGILGHSSGGYGAILAMIQEPDFYKVGVAGAPAVDMRHLIAAMVEKFQGPMQEQGENYDQVVLKHHVAKIKGKLLLSYSDLDSNVNAAVVIQFIDAMIKAGKPYDLFIYPNRDHLYWEDPYYVKRYWSYFVENLQGLRLPIEAAATTSSAE